MKILKEIKEERNWDNPQENPLLKNFKNYLNSNILYDETWTKTRVKVYIEFIRRMTIYENDGKVICEIRYDGTSALGKGKGITRSIPPNVMKPYSRKMKLQNILENDTNRNR